MTEIQEVYNAIQAASAGMGAEQGYQRRVGRIDLYDESIVLTRYETDGNGSVYMPGRGRVKKTGPGATYEIDPRDLAAAFAGQPLATGLLPNDCLGMVRIHGEERLVVYVAPQVRELHTAEKVYRVPVPGLVFSGAEVLYKVWAVKARPSQTSERLYHAPFPNVYSDNRSGVICVGNAEFPVCSAGTIWKAVTAFFESAFNDHLSNGKSRQHEDNVRKAWEMLEEADEYPLDDLVRTELTVGDVLGGERC